MNKTSIMDVADLLNLEPLGRPVRHCINHELHRNGDSNPSMGLNIEGNYFNCFGCGIAGNPIKLIQLVPNLNKYEAQRFLYQNKIKLDLPNRPAPPMPTKSGEEFSEIYNGFQNKLPVALSINGSPYLQEKRMIPQHIINNFGIKFINEGGYWINYVNRLEHELCVASGLKKENYNHTFNVGEIVIPFRHPVSRKIVYLQGRNTCVHKTSRQYKYLRQSLHSTTPHGITNHSRKEVRYTLRKGL